MNFNEAKKNKSMQRNLSLIFILIFIFPGVAYCEGSYKDLRYQMIENQIESRGIQDPAVLKAMEEVARHKFVPKSYEIFAYSDRPLPIGHNQTISQPYIVALMTSLLNLAKNDKVLEIGTGSGYQAAILAEICDTVYTIEIIEPLGREARQRLNNLDYDNVVVKIGNGYKGWKRHAPYDAIIVTCAPSHIPEPLKHQLAEGGRMVIPVGENYQYLTLLTKKDGKIREKSITPVRFVPMLNGEREKY